MLIAGMLISGTALAQGQQEAPAASQSPPSQSPPPAPAPSSSTSSSASDSKSEPVCFKLTGHCVDASKAPSGAKTGTAAAKADAQANGKSKGKKLNLTAPDVRTVIPEQELKEPLPGDSQITEVQEAQTVSVKTDEGVPPEVPMGLGAVWWAVVHPSQAWRILTPE